jgi:hypothetical protein
MQPRVIAQQPCVPAQPAGKLAAMSFAIALSDAQWELVADLFDPPDRRGAPAVIPRRQIIDAMLFIGRTGCQWRYLPERYGKRIRLPTCYQSGVSLSGREPPDGTNVHLSARPSMVLATHDPDGSPSTDSS